MFPKIVYFGTPVFAARVLAYLLKEGVPIAGVVTQPDRPQGRSGAPAPSAVKEIAQGLPLLQPEKSSDPQFLETLRAWQADLFVVVAFGQILPQVLLDIPPKGCINVHASLLPHLRGAAPMQRALMNGDRETGISIQKMVRKLDAGDVIAEVKMPIGEDTTLGELHDALCERAQPLLREVLVLYGKGIPPARTQDESRVTLAPKIEAAETQILWSRPPQEIHNQVRGLSPKPGAWTWVEVGGEKKRLKVLRTQVVGGELKLLEVQPEGRKPMAGEQWLRGLHTPPRFL